MIVTDRFVFLHLHKSGGSFVNECLLRFVPNARSIGYHLPRLLIPAKAAHLPVLGFVRNPWSYYVSWYNFQVQRPAANALFNILSDQHRLGFDATVRNMLELGSGSPHLAAVVAAMPTHHGNSGLNVPSFALAQIRNSGIGFYSFLYEYLYGGGGSNSLTIERAEDLRVKLLEYLESVGHRVTHAMNDFVLDTAGRNISEHGPYVDYYSNELRDLVAEKDRLIIARHGYQFGADLAPRSRRFG
jgi:hypothetical protein